MAWLLFFLLCLSPLSAETHEARGRRVVDEVVQALGGQAFLNMKNRMEFGRVYSFGRRGLSGLAQAKVYTRYRKAGDDDFGVDERQSFGKNEEIFAYLFSHDKTYEVTYRGVRPMPDPITARQQLSQRLNVFNILRLRLNEPGMVFYSKGSDIIDNQPVEIVEISDNDNRTVTVSFNQTTKFPLRQSFKRRDPKTRDLIEEVTIFSKYRPVNGVQWPFVIQRTRNGDKVYEIYSEAVEINSNFPDSLFELPSGIKMLKQEEQ